MKQTTENKSITPRSPEQTSKAASDWPAHCLIICYKLEKLCINDQYEEEKRLGEETIMTNLNKLYSECEVLLWRCKIDRLTIKCQGQYLDARDMM
jgi:hypothetical protein